MKYELHKKENTMKEFDFKKFYNNIQTDFLATYEYISYLERNEYFPKMYGDDTSNKREYDGGVEFNKACLVEKLECIKLKFDFAYEFLNLSKLHDQLNEEFKKYEGKLDKLKCLPITDDFYSPVLWLFEQHLSALTSHIEIDNEKESATINRFELLERILLETPKMLTNREKEPKNEAEVKNEVFYTLAHVFPDTVREIPISKVSKVYKPDIGIRSLKSAIEYKFVNSEQEAKIAIGGIFEDISRYEGSRDWTTFYAVIYMTDHFITQARVEAEFKLSKVSHHWKPIIVFGKGKRKSNPRVKVNGKKKNVT